MGHDDDDDDDFPMTILIFLWWWWWQYLSQPCHFPIGSSEVTTASSCLFDRISIASTSCHWKWSWIDNCLCNYSKDCKDHGLTSILRSIKSPLSALQAQALSLSYSTCLKVFDNDGYYLIKLIDDGNKGFVIKLKTSNSEKVNGASFPLF